MSVYIPISGREREFSSGAARTRLYGYSLFNLEAMVAICHILSEDGEYLWRWKTTDGRGVAKAIAFMFPYIRGQIEMAEAAGRNVFQRVAHTAIRACVRRPGG